MTRALSSTTATTGSRRRRACSSRCSMPGSARNASLLDGGLPEWKKANRPVTTEVPAAPRPGKIARSSHPTAHCRRRLRAGARERAGLQDHRRAQHRLLRRPGEAGLRQLRQRPSARAHRPRPRAGRREPRVREPCSTTRTTCCPRRSCATSSRGRGSSLTTRSLRTATSDSRRRSCCSRRARSATTCELYDGSFQDWERRKLPVEHTRKDS